MDSSNGQRKGKRSDSSSPPKDHSKKKISDANEESKDSAIL